MAIDKELLDQKLSGRDSKDLFAKDGLCILNAELDEHLADEGGEGDENAKRTPSSRMVTTLQSGTTMPSRGVYSITQQASFVPIDKPEYGQTTASSSRID